MALCGISASECVEPPTAVDQCEMPASQPAVGVYREISNGNVQSAGMCTSDGVCTSLSSVTVTPNLLNKEHRVGVYASTEHAVGVFTVQSTVKDHSFTWATVEAGRSDTVSTVSLSTLHCSPSETVERDGVPSSVADLLPQNTYVWTDATVARTETSLGPLGRLEVEDKAAIYYSKDGDNVQAQACNAVSVAYSVTDKQLLSTLAAGVTAMAVIKAPAVSSVVFPLIPALTTTAAAASEQPSLPSTSPVRDSMGIEQQLQRLVMEQNKHEEIEYQLPVLPLLEQVQRQRNSLIPRTGICSLTSSPFAVLTSPRLSARGHRRTTRQLLLSPRLSLLEPPLLARLPPRLATCRSLWRWTRWRLCARPRK